MPLRRKMKLSKMRHGRGLHETLRRCKASRVPLVLTHIIMMIFSLGVDMNQELDQFEVLAGRHRCTQAAWAAGRVAIPFEVKHDSIMYDILGDTGFCNLVYIILRTKEASGLSPWAPVCSSWVPINLGTSKRSKAFPLGHRRLSYVREANIMVSRTMLGIRLCQAFGIPWFLEQPCNSLMDSHPRFRELLRDFAIYKHPLKMKHHGGASDKGTWLYSPFKWLADIDKLAEDSPQVNSMCKPEMSKQYVDKKG